MKIVNWVQIKKRIHSDPCKYDRKMLSAYFGKKWRMLTWFRLYNALTQIHWYRTEKLEGRSSGVQTIVRPTLTQDQQKNELFFPYEQDRLHGYPSRVWAGRVSIRVTRVFGQGQRGQRHKKKVKRGRTNNRADKWNDDGQSRVARH